MFKFLWNAGVLTTGAAGAIGCFHTLQSFQRRSVLADSSNNDVLGHAELPDLDLELKQVQVIFRHGARTPLHVLDGFRQVPYDKEFIMRPHPLTLFPYERISSGTGLPIDWSTYEQRLRRKNLLSGGSIPGHLTSFGQEQMYGLGLRLRDEYKNRLGLSTFDPKQVYVISTNVTRTVESVRCVVAGIFGADHLKEYASKNGPLPILVSEPNKNILVPDTGTCSLLRQVNHAAMLHFDFVNSLKIDRERIEKHIDDAHDYIQNDLTEAQNKFVTALESYDKKRSSSNAPTTVSYNEDRQPCNYDKQLYEAIRERNEVSDKVSHFWHNVISHHPTLGTTMRKEDLKALMDLRKLEVEEFNLKFTSGYRIKFHFDSNPYFHNREICKEFRRLPDGGLVSSTTTNIKWKEGKQPKSKSDNAISFFSWLAQKDFPDSDPLSNYLEESWRNPLDYYQHVSYKMDHSTTKKLNFVFLYDDMKARVTHGWYCPSELLGFLEKTVQNGTQIMFYAMTGRHEQERQVVTSLSVGRMLLDMVDRAETTIKGLNPQRLCLYSSHDSTLVALFESLGIWKNQWPVFGADLRVEIFQDKNTAEFYAQVLLLGERALK